MRISDWSSDVCSSDLKDAGRTPQLLGEHRAREQMRPGRAAEREQQVGPRPLGIVETVGGADQEARLAHAVVQPAAKRRGDTARRPIGRASGRERGGTYVWIAEGDVYSKKT